MRLAVQTGAAVAAAFVVLTIWPAWGGGDAQLVEMIAGFPAFLLFVVGVVLMVLPSTRAGGWATAAYIAAMGGFAASFLIQFVERNDDLGYAAGMVTAFGALTLVFAVSALLPAAPMAEASDKPGHARETGT